MGGMAEVYLARDELLEREVAVKVLADAYAEDDEIRQRFTREALAAARLSGQRHVVTIYDVGEHEGRPYIVMAYMAGGSVEDRLRTGAQPPAQALTWLEQAASALDAAHREGIVHRDVKPGNLLLDQADVVHVGDFGIARAAGLVSLTSPGTVLGTAGYISPEQAAGVTAGPASDRYALGVVAFELLAGQRPFAAETPTAEALGHAHARPPRIDDVNPALPGTLAAVFDRALAKSPDDRPSTCGELVSDLRTAFWETELSTAILPPAPPTRVIAPRERRRVPWVVGLVAIALALLGVGIGIAVSRDGGKAAAAAKPPGRSAATSRTTVRHTTPARPASKSPRPALGPAQLNDLAYARLRAGDAQSALPLLERAVSALAGTGSLVEAYASYNLAWARFTLGRCDGVLSLLDRSQQIQGHRVEIDRLREQARRTCDVGHGHGHGKGNGNSDSGD
jgi:hypothetical protein